MKRNPLILASVGGMAVLAVAGATLGVAAADSGPAQATTLAAATTAPTTAATPGDSTTSAPATGGTSAAPGTPPGSGAPTAGGDAVSEQRAREIALARAGGGQVVEIEAEQEHGRPVWSVEIVAGQTEHEIDVDRENGTVVKAEQEPVDDDDDDDDRDDDDRDDD
ncbi:PepSY domain-containing protein [Micromonospora sp. NPDC047620]|uniref:PepSY domain-containing protein n=1 Tax=Micromonospora sp. NPDC047620 TaxID=3364251 RepID=UPI00371FF06B